MKKRPKGFCWLCGGNTYSKSQICWVCFMTGPDRQLNDRLLSPTEADMAEKES